MADFDYNSRRAIRNGLESNFEKRISKMAGKDKDLAHEIMGPYNGKGELVNKIIEIFNDHKDLKPSEWFNGEGEFSGAYAHKGLLDAFVPAKLQKSYLYIIDKLNQFPFSYGWQRRTVRTSAYRPQIRCAFNILKSYERLFYCGDDLENYIYRRFDEEKLDYIKNEWSFNTNFSYIYAAEIDLGNKKVINAFKDLILSENNTAYLDREMILGILRSDNKELHKLICDLLLAARLQEGLRQAICESMDDGTIEAFMSLMKVIVDNDLIRYSSVKRSVSTWIGIFDEKSVDRVNGKLLNLMWKCLCDREYCYEQLKTNDSIAISAALWALGFYETETAIEAMINLIDNGTKNQKLTASYYNYNLYDEKLKAKTAKKVILEYTDDIELVAAYMPAFVLQLGGWIWELLHKDSRSTREIEEPQKPVLTNYFADREEAELYYSKFWSIYERLPKKGVVFDPCIFPWYRVELKPSEIVRQLAFIAYVLEDEEKITKMAGLLGEVNREGYSSTRGSLLNLLLYNPVNKMQRELLINYMGNSEVDTSSKAIALVKKLTLDKDDYRLMEDMLRFKRSGLRGQLLEFLMKQDDKEMEECLKRLLNDKKEEKRSAGLDLLLRLSKKDGKEKFYTSVKNLAEEIENPTDKEKILLEEILGDKKETVSVENGYGIYNPDIAEDIPNLEFGEDILSKCISFSEQEIIKKIKKLDDLFKKYKDYEYETASGEKQLLSNGYSPKKDNNSDKEYSYRVSYCLKNYPLEDVFRDFYEKEIGDYAAFIQFEARLLMSNKEIYQNKNSKMFYKEVFGKFPYKLEPLAVEYLGNIQSLRINYRNEFIDKKFLFQAGLQAVSMLSNVIDNSNKSIDYLYTGWNGTKYTHSILVGGLRFFDRLIEGLDYWENDEEFKKAFYAAWKFELKCAEKREVSQFQPAVQGYNSMNANAITPITPFWFVKAYHMKLISQDILYKSILNYFNRNSGLRAITQLVKGEYGRAANRSMWRWFFGSRMEQQILDCGEEIVGKNTWCGEIIQQIYDAIVPVMVDIELRRGEQQTIFSFAMDGITFIQGIDYLIRILMALGKDTLGREAYYSWYYASNNNKKDVLSRLLKSSFPAPEDNGKILKKSLKGTSIKTDRLVEVAMYAPQWIDIIQEYLGWNGLKSGCYYFMAHMNEHFDDQKKAIIARYTPLSAEELQDGAFDIDWFNEAYEMLGEKNFLLLYKAAKYISDGQKHSRARKYADAAAGKVSLEELAEQINAKRNKDLLMSYGLVPFSKDRERDMLGRYQFIQNYAKEAKQFGAQRRASESKAAQTALVNLSVHAGFADVTRLILNMESRLAEEFAPYMEWTTVDDAEVCINVDETGKSTILCRKGEKMLKSVPSRLGKHAYVLELKAANKKLREQYSRTKKMMEEAMENGEEFEASEVVGLMENSVVSAILKPLVFISGKRMGFIETAKTSASKKTDKDNNKVNNLKLMIRTCDGKGRSLKDNDKLRIAHPLDLYHADVWYSYQKYLFDNQMRQPFKQVFRELYVKLPEELGLKASRMFAGNQIQPQKTVGCLKGRRWIADYEEGLQKVYYKENIVARIYALADWFSPSDVEMPTLEWVEFSDRKTFKSLKIEEVPDLIYSEVMRDVDLAVSVAHAGGVDPETSHSTIEMRRAIVEFNLPLFKIENVTLKDSHAMIRGTRGNYNVHLGSGVVHQEGGAMISILPVHSQQRGKLFLPFADEDPKTAEIMSKIVLLAEDKKIKDPFILDQIH